MKKQLFVILSVCVLLFTLTACGGNNQKNKSTKEVTDIVYNHAGVTEGDIRNFEIDLYDDDGVLSYEIEFEYNGEEYEYDVHARTGEILKAEKNGMNTLNINQ